ncbi:MAG: tRNA (N6-isopentenyl adenosine(37)-C2)-methylthiotransferase MiaB [Oligoflexales bacterium]|nr:tRNA (N6-isopentenyl adenosine(37)-C2)-methylthiotransferase MiaB [Oligoflexales bacterium]
MSHSVDDSLLKPDAKRIHIETWGCQMNVADSEKILSLMQKENFQLTENPSEADLIVLNTCHIREKARHKVVSRLGVLKELKQENKDLKIAVAGCVAQAEGKKLLKQAPTIDILMGPGKIDELPRLLKERQDSGSQAMAIGFNKPKYDDEPSGDLSCQQSVDVTPSLFGKNEISRFVNIQQGCDNFCTFCVVPFTRGREVSEKPEVIYAKAKAHVLHCASEITLLGQNVNSYGQDLQKNGQINPSEAGPFVDLLAKVASIPQLKRLRFTTSNPHDLTKPLADLFAQERKLGSYFHLPVQSGSDEILGTMRRKVTVAEYLERVKWLRDAVPDMAISTDLIVGFPSETEEDFQATLDLIEKVQFCFSYAFMYSPRKGTAAIRFKDQVPEAVKAERLARLNKLQNEITIAQNEAEIGKDREVLFLYESLKEPGIYYGRTRHFRLIRVASRRPLVGELAMVKVDGANKTALTGSLI